MDHCRWFACPCTVTTSASSALYPLVSRIVRKVFHIILITEAPHIITEVPHIQSGGLPALVPGLRVLPVPSTPGMPARSAAHARRRALVVTLPQLRRACSKDGPVRRSIQRQAHAAAAPGVSPATAAGKAPTVPTDAGCWADPALFATEACRALARGMERQPCAGHLGNASAPWHTQPRAQTKERTRRRPDTHAISTRVIRTCTGWDGRKSAPQSRTEKGKPHDNHRYAINYAQQTC